MISADTNVFVYAIDARDPLKRNIAQVVVSTLQVRRSLVALQVFGEFQNVATRKLKMPKVLAAGHASVLLGSLSTFPASRMAVRVALVEMAAGRLSYWDALMLASAAEAGCTTMLSEDMQDGATILGLEIVNPLGSAGMSPRAFELLGLS